MVLFRAPGGSVDIRDAANLLGVRLKGGGSSTWRIGELDSRPAGPLLTRALRLRGGLELLNEAMYEFSSNPEDSGAPSYFAHDEISCEEPLF